MAAQSFERLFQVDGNAKQKIIPLYYRTLRRFGAKPHHLLHDMYQAARSYLW